MTCLCFWSEKKQLTLRRAKDAAAPAFSYAGHRLPKLLNNEAITPPTTKYIPNPTIMKRGTSLIPFVVLPEDIVDIIKAANPVITAIATREKS